MDITIENKHVLLNSNLHKKISYSPEIDFSSLASEQILPIVLPEFGAIACENPIIFVKDNTSGRFKAAALYGLMPEQNLSVTAEKWTSNYMPKAVRNQHFKLHKSMVNSPGQASSNSNDDFDLSFDASLTQFTSPKGERLFSDAGHETSFLKNIKSNLIQYLHASHHTDMFLQTIANLGLLAPNKLTVDVLGKKIDVEGLYLISEEKFSQLSHEQFIKLREQGYLSAIYSHFISLNHALSLANKAAKV